MSIFQDVARYFTGRNKLSNESQLNKKKPLHVQIDRREYRIDATLRRWKDAVMAAEDPKNPRREYLMRLYDRVMEDNFLLSQVRTARFNVQMAGFIIEQNNRENAKLVELLDTPWFFKYLQYAVDTEMYGFSLIEAETDNDGFIKELSLIPRTHVKPEVGEVLLTISDLKGIPIELIEDEFNLISIGDPEDLGLLKSLSKAVIRKQYNLTDWGRRNERFGMPFVIAKTATRDKDELDAKEAMLSNFGANAYAILDDEDEIELIEPDSNSGGGHKSFSDLNEYIDNLISITVNGQTGTTDEKAYVGSAEVHERKENKYTKARMRRIQYHINEKLIPFLVNLGYPLINCKFSFNALEEGDESLNTSQEEGDTGSGKKKP